MACRSPGRRQAIMWTNAGILLIGPLGTNFSENLIEILIFSFTKMLLKGSSAKWRPFCLGLNVLSKAICALEWPIPPVIELARSRPAKDHLHQVSSTSHYTNIRYLLNSPWKINQSLFGQQINHSMKMVINELLQILLSNTTFPRNGMLFYNIVPVWHLVTPCQRSSKQGGTEAVISADCIRHYC